MSHTIWLAAALALTGGAVMTAQAPAPPADPNRRFLTLTDFRLESGVVMPTARVAYATLGTLDAAKNNAVLVPSYYGADYHGYDFLVGSGKALDPSRYFIVFTEMFGNGFSSSPSNTVAPMSGPDFPAIAIRDNVEASRRVLEHLGVRHLRAVVGFSMGAEQAFQWAVSHPDFMDGVAPWCGTAKTYPHGVVRLERDQGAHGRPGVRRWAIHVSAEGRDGRLVHALGRVGVVAGVVAPGAVQAAGGDGGGGGRGADCARRRARSQQPHSARAHVAASRRR
ncbi:MAG: alpha/beta fold hydrolase [Vicinamibacterales bacterium]